MSVPAVPGLEKSTCTWLPGRKGRVEKLKSAGVVLVTLAEPSTTPSTSTCMTGATPPAGRPLARTVRVSVMLAAGQVPRRAPLAGRLLRPGTRPAPSNAARPVPGSNQTPGAVGSSVVVPACR